MRIRSTSVQSQHFTACLADAHFFLDVDLRIKIQGTKCGGENKGMFSNVTMSLLSYLLLTSYKEFPFHRLIQYMSLFTAIA